MENQIICITAYIFITALVGIYSLLFVGWMIINLKFMITNNSIRVKHALWLIEHNKETANINNEYFNKRIEARISSLEHK